MSPTWRPRQLWELLRWNRADAFQSPGENTRGAAPQIAL